MRFWAYRTVKIWRAPIFASLLLCRGTLHNGTGMPTEASFAVKKISEYNPEKEGASRAWDRFRRKKRGGLTASRRGVILFVLALFSSFCLLFSGGGLFAGSFPGCSLLAGGFFGFCFLASTTGCRFGFPAGLADAACQRHAPAVGFDQFFSYTIDIGQVFERLEFTVLAPVIYDGFGLDRADSIQVFRQGGGVCLVNVDDFGAHDTCAQEHGRGDNCSNDMFKHLLVLFWLAGDSEIDGAFIGCPGRV